MTTAEIKERMSGLSTKFEGLLSQVVDCTNELQELTCALENADDNDPTVLSENS